MINVPVMIATQFAASRAIASAVDNTRRTSSTRCASPSDRTITINTGTPSFHDVARLIDEIGARLVDG